MTLRNMFLCFSEQPVPQRASVWPLTLQVAGLELKMKSPKRCTSQGRVFHVPSPALSGCVFWRAGGAGGNQSCDGQKTWRFKCRGSCFAHTANSLKPATLTHTQLSSKGTFLSGVFGKHARCPPCGSLYFCHLGSKTPRDSSADLTTRRTGGRDHLRARCRRCI